MATIVTVESFEDGFYTVKVKREFDQPYTRQFTESGLNEFVGQTKAYCEHKGYDFMLVPLEEKRTAGRPAVGTTKKVSLTLPDEVWELIGTKKKEWGVSQSQALRMMIEGYLYSADRQEVCDLCDGKGEIQEGFVYMKCPKCRED